MVKHGWWSVSFELTLDGESVRWDDLDECSQEHIAEKIKEGYHSGEIVMEEDDPCDNEGEPQKVMVYTSPRGKTITFDDWEDETEEYGIFWAEMCPRCRNKFRGILGKRISDDGAVGTCYVQGCWNEATYYAEFNKNEITFQSDTSDR